MHPLLKLVIGLAVTSIVLIVLPAIVTQGMVLLWLLGVAFLSLRTLRRNHRHIVRWLRKAPSAIIAWLEQLDANWTAQVDQWLKPLNRLNRYLPRNPVLKLLLSFAAAAIALTALPPIVMQGMVLLWLLAVALLSARWALRKRQLIAHRLGSLTLIALWRMRQGYRMSAKWLLRVQRLLIGLFPETIRWALEILVIVLLAASITVPTYYSEDRHEIMQPWGRELEWLTGHGLVAAQGLQQYGNIPMWNPFYRLGAPLVDNHFSYLLNPFVSAPTLLTGDIRNGTKLAITTGAIIAGIGGWFLAQTLGMRWQTRLLLGALLLGRASMESMIDEGFFQLGLQQAYFPWVIAATYRVLLGRQRWPIVMLALAMTLLFFTGNIWYILPMSLSVGALALIFAFHNRRVNIQGILRLAAATVLAFCLMAAQALPTLLNYSTYIGAHEPEVDAGETLLQPYLVPLLYVTSEPALLELLDIYEPRFGRAGNARFYMYAAYVAPFSFVLLLLSLLFLLPIPHTEHGRRLWLVGLALTLLFAAWGAGGTQLWRFLYEHIEALSSWRFVGRAFSVSSFWFAVLVALLFETVLRAIHQRPNWLLRIVGTWVLTVSVALVTLDVRGGWAPRTLYSDTYVDSCLRALRDEFPDEELVVWKYNYQDLYAFIETETRLYNIEADYMPLSQPNTIGPARLDLRQLMPAFIMNYQIGDTIAEERGFQPYDLPGQPECFFRNPEPNHPYAFTLPDVYIVDDPDGQIPVRVANPITDYRHYYDTVALAVTAGPDARILVIQETAYPGWQVWVDGEAAQYEVFGGMNAVILPPKPEGTAYAVVFMYRPPLYLLGSALTLSATAVSIAYVLRLDRPMWRVWQRRRRKSIIAPDRTLRDDL